MTVSFSMDNKITELSADGTNRLITKNSYVQSSTNNLFENDVREEVARLESRYNSKVLTSLCTGLTKIFVDTPTGRSEVSDKLKAINNFNSAYGSSYLSTAESQVDTEWRKIRTRF